MALTTNYLAYDLGASVMWGSPGWMVLNQYLLYISSSSAIIWIPVRATEAVQPGHWSITCTAGNPTRWW